MQLRMIKTLTVLVLGAGASKPFGFPTGQELLKLITHQLLLFTPEQTTLGQTLLACGFPAPDILRFASALHLSQRKSVDAFLEFRSEFLDVGKAAMIAALIPYEKPDTLFNTGDWYQHLLKAMEAPFDEMPKNQLGIIKNPKLLVYAVPVSL